MTDIERFDGKADAERLRSCFDIAKACWPVDEPDLPEWSLGTFTFKWADGFDASPFETWLATSESGEAVGSYLLTFPDKENVSQARLVLKVPPEQRRAGIGSQLLRHAADRARQAGRTRLTAAAWDDGAGSAFAGAVGASGGIAEVTRILTIDDDLRARLPGLRQDAEAHAADYELKAWTGLTPEEYLAEVASVHGAMADAPRDAGEDPTVWDAERLGRIERLGTAHGVSNYVVAAWHQTTGEIAAATQIITDPGAPDWGFQQITAVLGGHRGHRLGLLVKVAMLEYLGQEAPGVSRILTGNAGSNDHMISINALLGFEVGGVSRTWHLDLAADGVTSSR